MGLLDTWYKLDNAINEGSDEAWSLVELDTAIEDAARSRYRQKYEALSHHEHIAPETLFAYMSALDWAFSDAYSPSESLFSPIEYKTLILQTNEPVEGYADRFIERPF